MPKEIDMYNTYFGDCYMVKNEGSNLLVDFGIHVQVFGKILMVTVKI